MTRRNRIAEPYVTWKGPGPDPNAAPQGYSHGGFDDEGKPYHHDGRRDDCAICTTAGTSTTLSDFLLARLRAAQPYWEREWTSEHLAVTQHIARHDPAYVLADCAAKRAIVESAVAARSQVNRAARMRWEATATLAAAVAYEDAVSRLAAPFADHPEYQESWRP